MRKLNRLAKSREREYVKTGGAKCPFCGCEDIEATGDHDNPDASTCTQDVQCLNDECRKIWTEVYELKSVIYEDRVRAE